MKNFTRLTAILFSSVVIMSLLTVCAQAVKLKDINKHWAEEYINYGVEKGYISGYDDETFKPDNTVTRAEFAKMINSAVGLKKLDKISFSDVKSSDWFYSDICKAVKAGYVSGYEDGTFLPKNVITRQEAAVILQKITLPVSSVKASVKNFADSANIGTWAVGAVEVMVEKGFFQGDENNRFLPKNGLTRAQAAKLIYMFVENENIITDNYTIDDKTQLVSEVLFVGDVTVTNPNTKFKDCRIVGDLKITGSNIKLELEDTSARSVINNADGDVEIVADENSNVYDVVLNNPARLVGDNFDNVSLAGDDILSGTVELDGEFDNVVVSESAVVRIDGSVQKLVVNSSVDLVVQSGNVTQLEVVSGLKQSTIVLSKGVTIDDAQVDSPVSFTGSGIIKKANNGVSGISYETKPEQVTGKASVGDGEEGGLAVPTISPKNAATDVAETSGITITFNEEVFDIDGDPITKSYAEKIVSLTKTSQSGTEVDFTAAVTSGKKITIRPSSDLAAGAKYYISIAANKLQNKDGDTNAAIRSYFTVAAKDGIEDVTFSPVNAKTDVSIDTEITLTFPVAVYRATGSSSLSAAYLESTAIELRQGSATGTKVNFDATIDSTKKITIKPTESLLADTKYYVILVAKTLKTSDGTTNSKTTSYFTTANELGIKITPEKAATNVPSNQEIEIKFSEEIVKSTGTSITSSYIVEDVVELRKTSTSGEEIPFSAQISSDRKTITITPDDELEKGTKYYVIIKKESVMGKTSEVENEKISSYFTTAQSMTPIVSPADEKEGVEIDSVITVSFGDELYTKGTSSSTRVPVTSKYLTDNEVVLLRRTNASGTKIACEVTISDDGKTITLTPETDLKDNTKYCIVVKKQTLYNESGKYNPASTTYFKTAQKLMPEFVPGDGDKDVKVDTKLEIVFEEAIYRTTGADLTTSYLKNNVIRFYRGQDEDGTEIEDYSVAISDDKRTITITPDDDLAGDTDYFLMICAGTVANKDKVKNPEASIVFTTENVVVEEIKFEPETKSTGISVTADAKVIFGAKVYKAGGGKVTVSYADDYIKLRKGSSGGTAIDTTLTISEDGKTFTLTPKKELSNNTKYYIVVTANKFEYVDGTKITSKSAYFTTGDSVPVIKDFENQDVDGSSAKFVFNSNVDATLHVTAKPKSGDAVVVSKNIESGNNELVLEGLKSETEYTVEAYLETQNGTKSQTVSVKVTTTKAFEFEVDKVTDTTASFKVKVFANGKLTIKYVNEDTQEEKTKITNLSMTSGSSRTIEISDLDFDTQYTVNAIFVCTESEEEIEEEISILTENSEDYLIPDDVCVKVADADVYHAECDGDVYEVVIPEQESVKVKVVLPNDAASVKVNGKAVQNDTYTASIALTDGSVSIPIEITYGQQTKEYTLNVSVS